MSFRKRNAVVTVSQKETVPSPALRQKTVPPGIRPSPVDGRLTTSTGTASLDGLLSGHGGLPLGAALLVEEAGTTDFAGILARYYAAEGLVQGHHVHVLGYASPWSNELPAVSSDRKESSSVKRPSSGSSPSDDRMKIAWRYEALGNSHSHAQSPHGREPISGPEAVFCHSFDLSKRLAPASVKGNLHSTPLSGAFSLSLEPAGRLSPMRLFLQDLASKLATSDSSIHRVIVPALFSPALYTSDMCHPAEALSFMHSLRALTRLHSSRLAILITLPTSLHPRTSGLTRWVELLCDGVLELIPLQQTASDALSASKPDESADAKEQRHSQGVVRVHSLPVLHEKGGGGAEANYARENLAFSLSGSRGLVIKPFSLPPLSDDSEQRKEGSAASREGIEF